MRDGSDTWSADKWAFALSARYFAPAFAYEPVTYSTDADELASIRGIPPGEAIDDLTAAVRLQVMPSHSYYSLWKRCERWQATGCEGPPPSLPLLAVNVLAASRMTAQNAGAPNFYKPYRKLIDSSDDGQGMPGDYDEYVPKMWEQIHWWLKVHLEELRGVPTITRHEHFVNIGYAQQQAVLQASDRRRLYRFLRSIGFEPGDDIVPEELRNALAIWARRLGATGERLARLATEQSLQPYADELLRSIAQKWDGRIRDPRTGVIALPIRLLIEDRPFSIGLALQRGDDNPTSIELDHGDETLELTSQGAYFAPAPLPLDLAEVLNAGTELSGTTAAASFDPAPLHPLVYDDDLAGWVSTNGIAFGEVHALLIRKQEWAAMKAWIEAEGLAGSIDTAVTPKLPAGWFLIRRFQIDARPQHRPPPAIADLLGSTGGTRTRLVGGLTVGGLRRTYLLGGLPFLAIPSNDENLTVQIKTDGHRPAQLNAESGELPLNLVNLGPGNYHVIHPRGSTEFDIVEGISQHPGPDVGGVSAPGREGRSAKGLVATGPSPRPPVAVDVLPGETSIVIGPQRGDIALVGTPRWLTESLGELSWRVTDVWCDFAPTWLISPGSESASLIAAEPPQPGPGGTAWDTWVLRTKVSTDEPVAIDLWQRYQEAAREVSQ